jgi:hypothetical protein
VAQKLVITKPDSINFSMLSLGQRVGLELTTDHVNVARLEGSTFNHGEGVAAQGLAIWGIHFSGGLVETLIAAQEASVGKPFLVKYRDGTVALNEMVRVIYLYQYI